jgi:enoyl-CoA hydratase/carnithine racemase
VRARELVMGSFSADPESQMAEEASRIIAAGSTADFAEGVTAFIEKRTARFIGS